MTARIFVDTNILIYAHDIDAGPKHAVAGAILRELWESGAGALSLQVLQEFYVNVTRKIPNPLPLVQARAIIENYAVWHVAVLKPLSLLHASEIEERHRISFWDALIVAAAAETGAAKILTEDLNHGQQMEGVLVENPFLTQQTGRPVS